MSERLEGILPIHKPSGYTSHDVVAIIRRHLGIKKVGHTGTLDPLVTGVLPICIGRATRVAEYMLEQSKQYEVTLRFGIETDTYDLSGQVVNSIDRVHLTEQQVKQTLRSFIGTISQVPPMYSAVKIGGKKMYELARAGIEVERKARMVTIYQIEWLDLNLQDNHPLITFRVDCSKGTYIRSLCYDIGKKLGVPAVMEKLVRTRSGSIFLDQCVELETIQQMSKEKIKDILLQPDQAVAHFPSAFVHSEVWKVRALHGQHIPCNQVQFGEAQLSSQVTGLIRLYDQQQEFLGIYRLDEALKKIIPVKVFN